MFRFRIRLRCLECNRYQRCSRLTAALEVGNTVLENRPAFLSYVPALCWWLFTWGCGAWAVYITVHVAWVKYFFRASS
jgi:hypothetical protein